MHRDADHQLPFLFPKLVDLLLLEPQASTLRRSSCIWPVSAAELSPCGDLRKGYQCKELYLGAGSVARVCQIVEAKSQSLDLFPPKVHQLGDVSSVRPDPGSIKRLC